jgi:hypothetical protein
MNENIKMEEQSNLILDKPLLKTTLQGLLNKGYNNCSAMEKMADKILTLPRFLWLHRKVKLIKKNTIKVNHNKPMYYYIKNRCCPGTKILKYGYPLIGITIGAVFVVSSIIAIPFFLVGLYKKNKELKTNVNSKIYNNLIEIGLKENKNSTMTSENLFRIIIAKNESIDKLDNIEYELKNIDRILKSKHISESSKQSMNDKYNELTSSKSSILIELSQYDKILSNHYIENDDVTYYSNKLPI